MRATLTHVFQEQNKVADALVKERARQVVTGNPTLFEVSPVYAITSLEADTLGTFFVRTITSHNGTTNGYTQHFFPSGEFPSTM
ncbi:hypothetical protein H5410_015804 [Solanum commersonii]|uniref:Uncharacterized protein n=1 Tax=Solanum commersonii TaxID=4109 RepID=A0A9J5ZVH9_SOLCO|nr:hypothetical protein H5410_015804 [Solanum commersonii]